MHQRKLTGAGLLATLVASASYVFVYLVRWEWNRALVSASIFLAAEIGAVAYLLGRRLGRVERRLDAASIEVDRRRLETIRASQPPARVTFAWMTSSDRSGVFIPVLLGAGALLSGMAWVAERLARGTAGRVAEHGLAARLESLELPVDNLLDDRGDPLALLRAPTR